MIDVFKMIFIFVLVNSIYAISIDFDHNSIDYKITIDDTSIFLKGSKFNLSLSKKNCNKDLIKDFERELSKLQFFKHSKNGEIKYFLNKNEKKVSRRSKAHRFLLGIPDKMIELKLSCKISNNRKSKQ